MSFQVRDGGVWKPVTAFSVKDAGTWKAVQNAFVKDAGTWKQFYTAAVLLDFTVEVWGQGGQLQFTNITNYPRVALGGYNKVTVQALSNRTGTFTSGSWVGTTGERGGSGQFNIDGQWIVVAGGGSEPGNQVQWTTPGFNNAFTVTSNPSNPGTGGYNRTSGPSDASGELFTRVDNGNTSTWYISGGGGGGAPGGVNYPPATSINSGQGGQGNIRCYYDLGTTSGDAGGVATMSYVTGSTGVRNGVPQMIITNNATGRSRTYTYSGSDVSFPLSDIINY